MKFSNSDLIVLFVLGKKEKLSGKKIYKESKRYDECRGIRPQAGSSIYRSIQKLFEEKYLEKVEVKKVRGTVEEFYSLSKKGQSAYPEVRENILVWESVPDFSCSECDSKEVEECMARVDWEHVRKDLEVVAKPILRSPHADFKAPMLKTLFKNPGEVDGFIFWLNMLTAPKKILREKFLPQIQALGLEQEECLRT